MLHVMRNRPYIISDARPADMFPQLKIKDARIGYYITIGYYLLYNNFVMMGGFVQ